jgi:hypothetical protein
MSIWHLTGGRPMTRIGYAFTDKVSGRGVEYRKDKFGRVWLTDGGAWGLLRVETSIR